MEWTNRKNMLLRFFLQQRLHEYGRQDREYNKYSWKKYTACLLMITNLSLKDIARYTGVSYGLLRKWRTETLFKQMMIKNKEEYLNFFDMFITEMLKTPYQREDVILSNWKELKSSPTQDPEVFGMAKSLLNELNHQKNYTVHHTLKKSMLNLFLKRYKDNEYVVTFFRYPIIADLITAETVKEGDYALVPVLQMYVDWCLNRIPDGFDGYSEKKVLSFTFIKMKEYLDIVRKESYPS